MRKLKFYLPVLALTCTGIVFTTTSCVDDSESQSVVELRGAKAEYWKAEAAHQIAQGEAAKIIATAEAALKNAEAKRIEIETAKIAAETEQDKQRFELELKELEATTAALIKQAEADLEKHKLALLQAEQALKEEMAKADAEDPALKGAILAYQDAISEVNDYSIQLAGKKIELLKDEKLLVSLKANKKDALDELTRKTERNIADLNAAIEGYSAELKSWEDLLLTSDLQNINNEIKKAKSDEAKLLFTEIPALENKRLQAEIAMDNAWTIWDDFRNAAYNSTTGNVYSIAELNVKLTDLKADLTKANANKTKADADFKDATSKLEGLHKEYRTAETNRETAYTELEKAREDQQTVYNNPSSTQAQKDAADAAVTTASTKYNAAQVAETDKYNKYQEGQTKLTNAQYSLTNATYQVNWITGEIANIEDVKALYKDESTPTILRDAYLKASNEYTAAYEAKAAKMGEANALKSYYQTLENAAFNGTNLEAIKESKIKGLEDDIAEAKIDINNLKTALVDFETNNNYAISVLENQIAADKAKIAQLEMLLSAAQKQADSAKAIIDARTK
ncbi:MAG: hypothetical protein E6767_17450 [Dysgonomonas sp.]|nr:hypothetical protein [Dysgonomonas sp.]